MSYLKNVFLILLIQCLFVSFSEAGAQTHWELQNQIPTKNNLNAVWANEADEAYVVGDFGTILHFNGAEWQTMDSGTTAWLLGIWGVSEKAIFAVGENGIILHFNGITWKKMKSPTKNWLVGIWGPSENDLFAVGGAGTILHYNGQVWSEIPRLTNANLIAIWGNGSGDVFTAGGNGTALHFNGRDWTKLNITIPTENITGICGNSVNGIVAVSSKGKILRYDRKIWGEILNRPGVTLSGIWSQGPNNIFATITYDQSHRQSAILHYDGSMWSQFGSGLKDELNCVRGNSKSIFAVGDEGTILKCSGNNS